MPQQPLIDIGTVTSDQDTDAFYKVFAQALFFSEAEGSVWVDREGRDLIRVARIDGVIVGGWTAQPMGMFFGGRRIPLAGVRAVGVSAAHRSVGVAGTMMREAVDEAHRNNIPLAALYPATQPVYRKAGFELAGAHIQYRVPTMGIDLRERSLTVREVTVQDHPAMRELYLRQATSCNGNLDRNEWYWRRVLDPPPWFTKATGFLVEREGVLEGYVVFTQKSGASFHDNTIEVIDLVVQTSATARRIWSLFADHRSVAASVQFWGAPADPMLALLREQYTTTTRRIDWMLRIVNVTQVLEARGYMPGMSNELHLDITGDWIESNNGRFVLHVEGGKGKVEKGGSGSLKLDIRALAPLFSGYFTPEALKLMGKLEGDDSSLAIAAAMFAGSAPWMPDMF